MLRSARGAVLKFKTLHHTALHGVCMEPRCPCAPNRALDHSCAAQTATRAPCMMLVVRLIVQGPTPYRLMCVRLLVAVLDAMI